jgi:hypothetical protein
VTPNVTLRSNVCVGTLADFSENGPLVKHVKGVPAIKTLLSRLAPGHRDDEAARRILTPEQSAQLHETACVDCGFLTVGPARSPEGPVLSVRCPKGRCQSSILPTRELLCDEEMIRVIRSASLDPSSLVTSALALGPTGQQAIAAVISRIALRLPPHLYYRFLGWPDAEFASHVKRCLSKADARG